MAVNVADAKGLTFECLPGCGFCCTVSPLVGAHEAGRLPLAVRAVDGSLRIPIAGSCCSALGPDRRCTVYSARPTVCRLFPYAVHAGRRIQVTVSLACPGIGTSAGEAMEEGAQRAADLALAQPGAQEEAARAKATFAEFDRRMKEWNVAASPDKLRAAFLPHVATLAQPAALPRLFAGIAEGDLVLEGDAARVVAGLFETEADADVADLYEEGAKDAFDEPDTVLWVEPDLSWTKARASASAGARVELMRMVEGAGRANVIDLESLPVDWDPAASEILAQYLSRIMHRDHAEGAAAWLVDASGYQATPASAFARVVGEASLQVALRASLLAADERSDVVTREHARRGVMAYETAFHSLPTLGAIL